MSETPYSETSSDNLNSRRSSISECVSNIDVDHICNERSRQTRIELQIPIYVETLTGTTFELQVFPNDTISNIKLKLENMEGIPMARQHLIWQQQELRNEFTVEDYGITFGTILRLVIAVRGGPIAKSPTFFDIDSDTEEKICDPNNCHSRPLTVLVFHNGDQIKMFSITSTENTDSILNYDQFNDKKIGSANSSNNSDKEVKEKTESKQKEDEMTKAKMKEVQEKLKILQLKRISKNNNKKIDENLNNSQESKKPLTKLPVLGKVFNNNNVEITSKQKLCNSCLFLPPIIGTLSSSNDNKIKHVKSINNWDKSTYIRRDILQSSKSNDSYLLKRCLSLSPNTEINSKLAIVAENKHRLSNIHLTKFRNDFSSTLDDLSETIKKVDNQRPFSTPQLNVNNRPIFSNGSSARNRKKKCIANKLKLLDTEAKYSKASSTQKLPPLKNIKPRKLNTTRCSVCRIKLGIVMRFSCRCGLIFCGKHRYSEAHNCSYDYKAEGKIYLKMSNPSFASSKLPKI